MLEDHRMISIPIQIRFADIDMARHVHNAVYLHWFELARIALFRKMVPDHHDWAEKGLILARNEVDHRMPVELGDEISVETWCESVGEKSITLRYAVIRSNALSGICAEGRSVLVCYDHHQQKSVPVPQEWRSALEEQKNDGSLSVHTRGK